MAKQTILTVVQFPVIAISGVPATITINAPSGFTFDNVTEVNLQETNLSIANEIVWDPFVFDQGEFTLNSSTQISVTSTPTINPSVGFGVGSLGTTFLPDGACPEANCASFYLSDLVVDALHLLELKELLKFLWKKAEVEESR